MAYEAVTVKYSSSNFFFYILAMEVWNYLWDGGEQGAVAEELGSPR